MQSRGGTHMLKEIRTHETSPPNHHCVVLQLKNPNLNKLVLVEGYWCISTPLPPGAPRIITRFQVHPEDESAGLLRIENNGVVNWIVQ
jgi:hypothetical protein